MSSQTIPVVSVKDYRAGGAQRTRFVTTVGESLTEIGFFAIEGHDIDQALVAEAYSQAQAFFALPEADKLRYRIRRANGQRGYTSFGTEHAKDSQYPDLKEFYQIGRTDVPEDHPVHQPFGPNIWPQAHVPEFRPVMSTLYRRLDRLAALILEACALYIGEPGGLFRDMATGSDTILRVIYYPPLGPDTPAGSIRSAAHEDINLITLLLGATAEGLELLRRDGTWLPITANPEQIIIDSGDMLQNVTNGLFRSTTHRVVNPADPTQARMSMPCFVHPRREIDLTPLPSCVAKTGGTASYPALTAGEYLDTRLREIGLIK